MNFFFGNLFNCKPGFGWRPILVARGANRGFLLRVGRAACLLGGKNGKSRSEDGGVGRSAGDALGLRGRNNGKRFLDR